MLSTVYLTIFGPEFSLEGAIFLGIIIVVVIMYSVYDHIKGRFSEIDNNTLKITELQKETNYINRLHDIEKRVVVLEESMLNVSNRIEEVLKIFKERKGNKGQIDPQTLMIIILIILLILFFASIGAIQIPTSP